jgi:hypothetical protein
MDAQIHVFLASALVGRQWSVSSPVRLSAGKITPGTHWTGGSVGPRTSVDDVERRKILPLSRLARSQSLYRLSCRGSFFNRVLKVCGTQ